MKAAVMYKGEELPRYTDFAEPVAEKSDEILVRVKAVAIKHLDKLRAAGKHYSAGAQLVEGRVIGGDAVCLLEDGTRVYGVGVSGTMAEKATIDKDRFVQIPQALDDAAAAALPNAVMGAAMGLRFKADIKPGDVVLINGATGFTGRMAVQIAKHYGARKVIATGRNPKSLGELAELGTDEIVALTQSDDAFKTQLKAIHAKTPVDVVIDYLWGHTAEMILECLKGNGGFTNRMRYVSVGGVTGDTVQLSSSNLRSINLQLSGSGLGAWTREQVGLLFTEILPEMFKMAAEGKLKVHTKTVKLQEIGEAWNLTVDDGQRLVVMI